MVVGWCVRAMEICREKVQYSDHILEISFASRDIFVLYCDCVILKVKAVGGAGGWSLANRSANCPRTRDHMTDHHWH
jgi:hypothetical protein